MDISNGVLPVQVLFGDGLNDGDRGVTFKSLGDSDNAIKLLLAEAFDEHALSRVVQINIAILRATKYLPQFRDSLIDRHLGNLTLFWGFDLIIPRVERFTAHHWH